MISKEESIGQISFSQSGQKYIKGLSVKDSHVSKAKLPCEFEYNKPWELKHECINCNISITISENPSLNFYKIDRLYDKYYAGDLLKSLAKVLTDVKVFKSDASEFAFLTTYDFKDEAAISLFIPQITLNYYRCNSCESEYLMRFRQGMPQYPDKSNPKGMPGKLFIDEIISFCVDSGVKFDKLIKEFAH